MKKLLLSIAIVSSVLVNAQSTLTQSLQACYPLNCYFGSTIANGAATGSALDGTVYGTVNCVTGHLGVSSTAVEFGGTTADYIELPNNSLIRPTTSLSVSGWFYVNSLAHQDIIFTKNSCSSDFNAYNMITENGSFWMVKKPGAVAGCNSGVLAFTPTLTINQWHHVVFYVDNTIASVTVDNSVTATAQHNVIFDYDPSTGVILGGTNEGASNFPYTGRIDNLRFYNRKLTSNEIGLLYSSDPACIPESVPTTLNSYNINEAVNISPNPSSGKFTVQAPEIKEIRVKDITGQQISFDIKVQSVNSAVIDLANTAPGIYFLQVIDSGGHISQPRKIIVTN